MAGGALGGVREPDEYLTTDSLLIKFLIQTKAG